MPPLPVPRALSVSDPGKYRDQVRVQYKSVTGQDSRGQDIYSWETLYAGYAHVRQLAGSEAARVGQKWADASCEVEMQYVVGITEAMRVSWWDGASHRNLDILSAIDPVGDRRKLWIYCKEVKGRPQ